jgi:hypothetical protein
MRCFLISIAYAEQVLAQSRSTRARFLDEPLGKSYPQLACDIGIQDQLFNHDIFEGQVLWLLAEQHLRDLLGGALTSSLPTDPDGD